METKKIAIACFVGGIMCTTVALMVAPVFWWLGLFAGFTGGYLGYEFREVLRATPIAWRNARESSKVGWIKIDKKVKAWFAKPHPFCYFAAVVTVMPVLLLFYYHGSPIFMGLLKLPLVAKIFLIILFYLYLFLVVWILWMIALVFVTLFAFIGAKVGEHCFWTPFSWEQDYEKKELKRLKEAGYFRTETTYKNVLRWTLKGVWLTFLFFVWTMWKHLSLGIWLSLCFLQRFLWNLFKLIHSKKRVLCAIDGTLGGTVAFFWFASMPLLFPQQILVVFFGGLLGATFGALNYEIISKRLLHLAPATNKV